MTDLTPDQIAGIGRNHRRTEDGICGLCREDSGYGNTICIPWPCDAAILFDALARIRALLDQARADGHLEVHINDLHIALEG